MAREPYEAPTVEEQSVEEMLSDAQRKVDEVFEKARRLESKADDMSDATGHMTTELEALQEALTAAETAVQKVTYVAKVRGEHDAG